MVPSEVAARSLQNNIEYAADRWYYMERMEIESVYPSFEPSIRPSTSRMPFWQVHTVQFGRQSQWKKTCTSIPKPQNSVMCVRPWLSDPSIIHQVVVEGTKEKSVPTGIIVLLQSLKLLLGRLFYLMQSNRCKPGMAFFSSVLFCFLPSLGGIFQPPANNNACNIWDYN